MDVHEDLVVVLVSCLFTATVALAYFYFGLRRGVREYSRRADQAEAFAGVEKCERRRVEKQLAEKEHELRDSVRKYSQVCQRLRDIRHCTYYLDAAEPATPENSPSPVCVTSDVSVMLDDLK